MKSQYQTPDLKAEAFARTNTQTINQRVALLQELLPNLKSIAELRLIHYSYSSLTGNDNVTEPRLKYIEIWFSIRLNNEWEL